MKRIAIIGGGLAGTSAAHHLNKHGYHCDIYEARERVGGRVWSVYHTRESEDMLVEMGGQNITDGGDATNILELAHDLRLPVDVAEVDLNCLVYNDGKTFDYHNLLRTIAPDIHSQNCSSIGDLIDNICKDPNLNMALKTIVSAYEGIDAYEQSIYHNIETLEAMLEGDISKFHNVEKHGSLTIKQIRNGNARICEEIASHLSGNIYFGNVLTALKQMDDSVHLHFKNGKVEVYDFVVMTVPASTYHNIDFVGITRPNAPKYGANYKVILPITQKSEYRSFITKYGTSFFNFHNTVPLLYLNSDCDLNELIRLYCEKMNVPISGISYDTSEDKNFGIYKNILVHKWGKDEFALGSYSGYSTSLSKQLDEYVEVKGIKFKSLYAPSGSVVFAGEHTTTLECIGTMEAAVESGKRAAIYLLRLLE